MIDRYQSRRDPRHGHWRRLAPRSPQATHKWCSRALPRQMGVAVHPLPIPEALGTFRRLPAAGGFCWPVGTGGDDRDRQASCGRARARLTRGARRSKCAKTGDRRAHPDPGQTAASCGTSTWASTWRRSRAYSSDAPLITFSAAATKLGLTPSHSLQPSWRIVGRHSAGCRPNVGPPRFAAAAARGIGPRELYRRVRARSCSSPRPRTRATRSPRSPTSWPGSMPTAPSSPGRTHDDPQ